MVMETKKLKDIIGSTAAISPRRGLKAYEFISDLLEHSESVTVSFEDITDFTSAFCNSFIGKLYMNFDPDKMDSSLHLNLPGGRKLWKNKIHNARLLGTNENVRSKRQASLDDLMFS